MNFIEVNNKNLLSFGTTELHYSSKKWEHSFSILKSFSVSKKNVPAVLSYVATKEDFAFSSIKNNNNFCPRTNVDPSI